MKPRIWPMAIIPGAVVLAAWYAAIRADLVWPVAVATFGLVAVAWLAWWAIQPGRKA